MISLIALGRSAGAPDAQVSIPSGEGWPLLGLDFHTADSVSSFDVRNVRSGMFYFLFLVF